MLTATRIVVGVALTVLATGCASSAHPTPSAIYRHPVTGDIQWCDKPSGAAMALGGAIVAASQGADYAGCKTSWESKGYSRLDATAKLSVADQQRYEEERARLEKATADSIRKN
jgi:hypothetical protein